MSVSVKRQCEILSRLQYEIDYVNREAARKLATAYELHKMVDEHIYSDWHEYDKLSDGRKSVIVNMVQDVLQKHARDYSVFCYNINGQIKTSKELTREDHEIIHKKKIEGNSYVLKEVIETSPNQRTVVITKRLTDKIYFLKSEYELKMIDFKNSKKGKLLPEYLEVSRKMTANAAA